MTYQIRQAIEEDIPRLVWLCQQHAAYEKSAYTTAGKEEALKKALFQVAPPLFYCLVLDIQGMLKGYVTYMQQFSTWDVEHYMYMDCLFLCEEIRGQGLGEKLVNKVKAAADQLNCQFVQWQTPDFNTRAMRFYRRIGATSKTKERFFLTL